MDDGRAGECRRRDGAKTLRRQAWHVVITAAISRRPLPERAGADHSASVFPDPWDSVVVGRKKPGGGLWGAVVVISVPAIGIYRRTTKVSARMSVSVTKPHVPLH